MQHQICSTEIPFDPPTQSVTYYLVLKYITDTAPKSDGLVSTISPTKSLIIVGAHEQWVPLALFHPCKL